MIDFVPLETEAWEMEDKETLFSRGADTLSFKGFEFWLWPPDETVWVSFGVDEALIVADFRVKKSLIDLFDLTGNFFEFLLIVMAEKARQNGCSTKRVAARGTSRNSVL